MIYVTGIWEAGKVPSSVFEETWSLCLASFALMAACTLGGSLFTANLAYLVRGKNVPSEFGYWDSYVDLWHISNKLLNVCVNKRLLMPFWGTPWVNKVVRLISSAQIDSSALIVGGTSFRDLDMVRIGPRAVVNAQTVLRTHTFEDWK